MAEDRDPVAVFRSAAERYVAVIEEAEGQSAGQLSADLVRVLPALYEAALRLPELVVESDELPETRVSHEQWGQIFGLLQRIFGADALVLAEVNDRPVGIVSLADDLADVYRDVKEGLDLLATGESISEVVWHWRFNFWTHWGTHALDALRVVHAHLVDSNGPSFEQSDI